MKRILLLPCLFLSAFMFNSCQSSRQSADLILINGFIHIVDDSMNVTEALVIKDSKVLFAGSSKEVKKHYTATETIDLKGQHVYPGFIDAHCHFLGYARSLEWADLGGAESLTAMLEGVKQHASSINSEWILGRGWDQNKWEDKALPQRGDLDSLFPDRPVMLTRVDGHAIVVNTFLLRMAGLDKVTDNRGGEIMMEKGTPTGVLLETTADLVKALVPKPQKKALAEMLLKAQEDCYAVGLSSVHDAGLDFQEILFIDSLQKDSFLNMHINAMLNPGMDNFNQFLFKGPYVTDKLIVRSIKLYADGALGSRGALLLEPYSDMPGHQGISVLSYDSMKYCASIAYEMGYQVSTHAIGDSAVRKVLKLYSELLRERNDFRWRIEHCQVVNPSDLNWFREYSIIPSVNAVHAVSDMAWAGERLGPQRVTHAYAYAELLKQNAWLCNGSDFPVEEINPLHGFLAACLRQNTKAQPQGGFQPENAISRADALRAMTIWAAKAAFDEQNHGSLEVGKRADFVILDVDLMSAKAEEIAQAAVRQTFVDGKQVFPKR